MKKKSEEDLRINMFVKILKKSWKLKEKVQ